MLRSYAFDGPPMNRERFWQTTKVVMNSKVKGYASVVVNQLENTRYFKVKGGKKQGKRKKRSKLRERVTEMLFFSRKDEG